MALFNDLPEGCHHLAGYLNSRDQAQCADFSRQLIKTHPLATPTTKSGYEMSLKVTSWGKAGWFGSDGCYVYLPNHPKTYEPWPEIPKPILNFMHEARVLAGYPAFEIETVLLNWYAPGTGKLGMHQDVTEQDRDNPIITISLGDDAVFALGSTERGGKVRRITLRSGDVFVMGGESRLLYHGIEKLVPSENPLFKNGGRISLTGRKIYAVSNRSD